MTEEQIAQYEKVWINKIPEIQENAAYVLGKNPTLYRKKPQKDPDWRVSIPLAKSTVEDLTGYAAKTGHIVVSYRQELAETEAEEALRKTYEEVNKKIYVHNEAQLETSELYNQALTQGEAYELFWLSEGDDQKLFTPEFAMVANEDMVLVYDGSLKPKLSAAIRYYKQGLDTYAEAYFPYYSESWIKLAGKKKWDRDPLGDNAYPYSEVPLAVYKINRFSQPLFEAEKEVIDAHDNLISKSVNEIDRFNALVALFPNRVDAEFVKKLEQYRIMDGLGEFEKWPEYLEKSLSKIDAFYQNLANRLERLYHKTSKVPDFSDENFAGRSSGISLAYKLLGLEFKAAQVDSYFNKGLRTRQNLIDDVLNSSEQVQYPKYAMDISNKRNLPVDTSSAVEIATKLLGVVSKETLLRILPEEIVNDVDVELERIDKEFGGFDEDSSGMDLDQLDEALPERSLLNGSQVSSVLSVVEKVAAGELDRSSALELVQATGISAKQADLIIPGN